MRLVRGTGLAGLAGIPPVRGNILRPMLGVSQQEIWAYLEENRIPHMEDSTNAQDDCLRNRIRHHVVPLLEQENPNLSQQISRMTVILRAEDQVLEEISKPQGTTLDRAALLSLPDVLQYRQMRQFLNIPGVTQGHIQSALDLCRRAEPSGSLALPEGCTLVREYENIKLLPKENLEIPQEIRLNPNSTVQFGPWQVTCQQGPRPEKLPPDTVALDPEALDGPLMLRCRQPGDRIRLPGGTKKLARLLIDEKIPARWRDSMPVVTVNGAIAAILPVKAAAFCRPEPGRDSLLLSATRMEDTQ
jgi:tRNA(Ile)-lysidine synthetase-like protein